MPGCTGFREPWLSLRESLGVLVFAIVRRMPYAFGDTAHDGEYDFIVVNAEFDRALADRQTIARATRRQLAPQREALRRRFAARRPANRGLKTRTDRVPPNPGFNLAKRLISR